ncbi:AGE family epimerase/isomerase [Luteimicrobium subarcticum]|uniref:Mannose/cellobiose epimerase-like protein (N-acyl-D-glucosamine 2-epimerase family) n=1 Tax=Luteimicrobium subarcticum TaxID=620910 RepID=A0A2M8WRM1_9MICO|nr:AGE family epimerase/isomerase [Luteimicrobium subarcticum]PJI93587.1 mannose/cellobiose epimerase-like protein (N-acyl-D-glucosamine 2-epimerase family) [Luteimicrobium subarcticum]
MSTPWTDLPTHRAWLQAHGESLLAFGRRVAVPGGGAAWLDDEGAPVVERGVQTWITCRTVHVYALGHLLGVPGSRPVAQGALAALLPGGVLHDAEHGGWFGTVRRAGAGGGVEVVSDAKEAYQHAFVLLAASSGVVAGLDGARELLDEAARVYLDRFWDEDAGLSVDTWDRAFTACDPYRGINANMHSVEAMLAVADVTGDPAWLDRAARIGGFVVRQAAAQGWRIPEHYSDEWVPEPDLNRDCPDDPFKPFGATVGHGLEWARLLLHLEAALVAAHEADPGLPQAGGPVDGAAEGSTWAEAAAALFERAVADGWAADGADGFVYTTDWAGEPVVRDRMHWVVAEATNAAAALHTRTGEPRYADRYAQWWDYADRYVLDHEHGSWHHELDPTNTPAGTVWPGKADLYHAFQATLVPRLPLAPSMATAVASGLFVTP